MMDFVEEVKSMTIDECHSFLVGVRLIPSTRHDPNVREAMALARQKIIKSGEYDHGYYDKFINSPKGKAWSKAVDKINWKKVDRELDKLLAEQKKEKQR